jgi:beta-phosphoglucomutase-like phosphatase (HAD superfamily)
VSQIDGILWDNDGVLVDTERLFYQSNRELFLPFGIDLSELDFLTGICPITAAPGTCWNTWAWTRRV